MAPLRALMVTCMRDEGPFLLEWLAHHKAVGFTDFLIYSNDCRDGTDKMLRHLEKLGEIRHFNNAPRGRKTVQWQALTHASRQGEAVEADWIMSADVDEFLVIKPGAGRLDDLFAASPATTGFALTWRMFGNGGQVEFDDVPVTEKFRHCAPDGIMWPWPAIQFKCLYRNNGTYAKLGVHRPKAPDKALETVAVWRDGSGNPLPWHAPQGMTMIPTMTPKYELAQLNHYALGSVENFLVKADRGKPNHAADPINEIYWRDRNLNSVIDDAIDLVAPERDRILAAWLDDPKLRKLHDASIAWRQERIAEILATAEGQRFFENIKAMPPTPILPEEMQKIYMAEIIKRRQQLAREKKAAKSG